MSCSALFFLSTPFARFCKQISQISLCSIRAVADQAVIRLHPNVRSLQPRLQRVAYLPVGEPGVNAEALVVDHCQLELHVAERALKHTALALHLDVATSQRQLDCRVCTERGAG